ncbi:MAG: ApaLI family restriction endonuclease [Acidobacteria bacterium]|nr:ApaLI family restriction endonuclease [Acidobacteriota bacterium]
MGIEEQIKQLADQYANELQEKMNLRVREMENDDQSHFLIYRVLGVAAEEGQLIDEYQNKGRLLYNNAGTFLEKATMLCFQSRFPEAKRCEISNTRGKKPKKFEIDCLINNDAIEIKWRDATTDGDHKNKERTRLEVIQEAGYRPIRVMFYYPNRAQAVKIQAKLKGLYEELGGLYFSGASAWNFVYEQTGIDLKMILERLADEKVARS